MRAAKSRPARTVTGGIRNVAIRYWLLTIGLAALVGVGGHPPLSGAASAEESDGSGTIFSTRGSSGASTEIGKDDGFGAFRGLPLSFISNAGQTDQQVKYYAKGPGFGVYFTPEKVVFSLVRGTSSPETRKGDSRISSPNGTLSARSRGHQGIALAMEFIGVNPKVTVEGRAVAPGKVNFFLGNDPANWRAGLSTYREVVYRDLWQGIDGIFRGVDGQIKYEFVVHPGASVDSILLAYRGIEDLSLNSVGDLVLKTSVGEIIDERPYTFEKTGETRTPVDSRYVLHPQKDGSVAYGFEIVGDHDSESELVIDPGLEYSTYLGGGSSDGCYDVAVDSAGSAYLVGRTRSVDFPTMVGAFQGSKSGGQDGFVTKLDPSGTSIVYSTYLGGGGLDQTESIVVDLSGHAYVLGTTTSSDFPVTPGAFQSTRGTSNVDSFVTKLSPNGSSLVYSTYIQNAAPAAIAVDAGGLAFVVGQSSGGAAVTGGGYQTINRGGGGDAYVAKLNAAGSSLVFGTYLGGSGVEIALDLAIDAAGSPYVVGTTRSSDFPITPGAFQTTRSGGVDGFVTKLTPDGSALVYSTLLGGSAPGIFSEESDGVAVDAAGCAYVTGATQSVDFPTTPGAFQTSYGGGGIDSCLSKLKADGSGLVYSTYLGGSDSEGPTKDVEVDGSGSAYVYGATRSPDFPLVNPIQSTLKGPQDVFVVKFSPDGAGLLFSTLLGGSSVDGPVDSGIALDAAGCVYIAGETQSTDFPTASPFQPTLRGVSDGFVAKICLAEEITVAIDIKPQSCPNPLNTKGKGILPVAILGTEDFDVLDVDPATVLLESVPPIRDGLEDVAAPVSDRADVCDCTTDGPDGLLDLTLKYDRQSILQALVDLGEPLLHGDQVVLTLTGELFDGTPIEGQDCVVIVGGGQGRGRE